MAVEGTDEGDVPAELDPEGSNARTGEAEFIVNSSCHALAGRDDVELFVSFDPWNKLEGGSFIEAVNSDPLFDVFAVVSASALGVEGCDSCETTYAVEGARRLQIQRDDERGNRGR